MNKRKVKGKKLVVTLAACAVCAACGAVGCTPASPPSTPDVSNQSKEEAAAMEQSTGLGATVEATESANTIQANRTALVPEMVTREDGTQTQRTPSEYPELKMWYFPDEELEGTYAYNIQALDTDNRGCNACHDDLAETIQHIGYPHVDLRNNFGINITVDMCLDCHTYQPLALAEQYGFKEMIHNIHYKKSTGFEGTCMSCHAQLGDDPTMRLFDDVKYDLFRGMVDVENVQGEFTYTQDETTELEDLWDFPWYSYENDYMRVENEKNNVPLDQALFDSWTITISGAVQHETTFNLKELVDKGYGEEVTLTGICTMNPQGGPFVANLKVKGIPVARLFEEVGLNENVTGFNTIAADGYGYWSNMDFFNQGYGGYLVYEIDGKPLSWTNGYPVTYWVQGSGSAGQNSKQISDIVVLDTPLDPSPCEGNPTEEGWIAASDELPLDQGSYFTNKPCVGIFDTPQGEIVNLGETYTFHGYADSFEQAVTSVEFSMDNGVTWTKYDTPDTTSNNWVTWKFDFTPEQRGAYVLAVRATGENGITTAEPVKVMINVKDK